MARATANSNADEVEGESTPETGGSGISDLLNHENFKAAANFLGIVGAAGGGFAALAYGIGYLAIKNHDEMVGLPTTVVTSATYVRTGALFFPDSVYHMFTATIFYIFFACLSVLLIRWAYSAFRRCRFLGLGQRLGRLEGLARRNEAKLCVLAHVVLLILGVYLLHLQIGAFDPEYKSLLFSRLTEQSASVDDSDTEAAATDSQSRVVRPTLIERAGRTVTEVRSALAVQRTSTWASRIRDHLISVDGARWLHRLFGATLLLIILYAYALGTILRWRRRLCSTPNDEAPVENSAAVIPPAVVNWLIYPVLCAFLVALVLNLPASYGILCLPNNNTWVMVTLDDDDDVASGYILSDLSTEPDEIWMLGVNGTSGRWEIRVFDRSEIVSVEFTSFSPSNILALEQGAS